MGLFCKLHYTVQVMISDLENLSNMEVKLAYMEIVIA